MTFVEDFMEFIVSPQKILYLVLAILISLFINYFLIRWAFNDMYNHTDSDINKTFQANIAIPITTGLCDFNTPKSITTFNEELKNYLKLPTSVNKKGIEQSYSFWMKIGDESKHLPDRIIFMRGIFSKDDTKVYKLHNGDDSKDPINEQLVKCPLVKFGNSIAGTHHSNSIVIQFNTLNNPHNEVILDSDVMKIFKSSMNHPRYYLVTLTFQDNIAYNGNENGVLLSVYVNDSLIKTHHVVNDALKINTGDILLNPNASDTDKDSTSFFGDLTYYNFALSTQDIIKIFKIGPTNGTCALNTQSSTTHLSNQYESLSLYNELQQI